METDLETTTAQMTGATEQRMAALEAALTGTGAETWAVFRELRAMTSALPGVGKTAASRITELRKDDTLPRDHRFRVETETRTAATTLISRTNDAAQKKVAELEERITAGILPQPHKDPAMRSLHRQELQQVLGGKLPGDLAEAARKYILSSQNPTHDSELLGDFGRALFHGAGVGDEHPALRNIAVDKYLTGKGPLTAHQAASRRALEVFRGSNLAGAVAAYREAARMHLSTIEK